MIIEIEITLKRIALFLVFVTVLLWTYQIGYDEGVRDMIRINCGLGITSGGV